MPKTRTREIRATQPVPLVTLAGKNRVGPSVPARAEKHVTAELAAELACQHRTPVKADELRLRWQALGTGHCEDWRPGDDPPDWATWLLVTATVRR